MNTYTADNATTRITKYGFDSDLTRTFEYCEKSVTAGDYNGTRIELFIDLAIRGQIATIENGGIAADDLLPLPLGVKVVRTHQLMDAFKDADTRGELDPWIADELAHLRQFSQALAVLATDADY